MAIKHAMDLREKKRARDFAYSRRELLTRVRSDVIVRIAENRIYRHFRPVCKSCMDNKLISILNLLRFFKYFRCSNANVVEDTVYCF